MFPHGNTKKKPHNFKVIRSETGDTSRSPKNPSLDKK